MRLKAWFSNQQIQKKLLIINGLTVISVLIPILCIMSVYEYYALRETTLKAIRVDATIVSDNAATAMAFKDSVTASEALATLQASTDIQYAALVLPEGELLASYNYQGQENAEIPHFQPGLEQTEELTWNRFKITKPVFLKSEFVGALKLDASLDIVYQRILLYFGIIFGATIISLFLSLWLATKLKELIVKPLLQLMDSVNRVTVHHDYSVRPEVVHNDEIGDLAHAFRDMMCKLEERDDHLQGMAFYDGVTGLPNRHFFEERIGLVVNHAIQQDQRCCLLFIDLDDFKQVNDNLGHHIGDELLKLVGRRLKESLRQTDLICRIGGDEFAAILRDIKEIETSKKIAAKLITAVSEPAIIQGHEVKVGASIGISICPDFATDSSTLIQTADAAMYVAKGSTKNTYRLYQP